MSVNAKSLELVGNMPISRSFTGSQKWVLQSMQNFGSQLVTLLWRILGNEQDVCDAYQDTFLNLAHYKGGSKPKHVKAYIFRTAANTALSMLRRKILERKNLAEINVEKYHEPSLSNELDTRHLREKLRYCIAKLPEQLRNVVTMHDLGEMSYLQVAEILNITEATARVYRCKAIRLLAVWMK